MPADGSYRTHPVRKAFQIAPWTLTAGLLLGIGITAFSPNAVLLAVVIAVQLIALVLATATVFVGGASTKWFADPRMRESMPQIYPREFAYRCALGMIMVWLFIPFGLGSQRFAHLSEGSQIASTANLFAFHALTWSMTFFSLFILASNHMVARWALDHAYRASGRRHYLDIGIPQSLIDDRQDYVDDWARP